jgi:ABC-2 type transport system permease protein
VYLRDTQHFLELALLAWFWVTPIVYGFMTIDRRPGGWFKYAYLLNPVTPIVLIYQRTIYAKLDNSRVPVGSSGREILPHWHMSLYLGYLGYSFAVGLVILAIAISVFGRSEANFAEEL